MNKEHIYKRFQHFHKTRQVNSNICVAYYEFWLEISEQLSPIPYNPSIVFVKQLLQSINPLLPKSYQRQTSQNSVDIVIAVDLIRIHSNGTENIQNYIQTNVNKLKNIVVELCSSTEWKSMHDYKELVISMFILNFVRVK